MKTKTQNEKAESKNAKAEFEKKTYVMVPPREIIVDESKNPRTDYGEVGELMNSIIENGIRNPLKGYMRDGKIYLREGFRRMRAVKLALQSGKQIERVPIFLEERAMSEEERTLEFLINNDGKPFTMLEQAEVIRRLLNFQWKVTDIVKRTGKARGYIENLIMLANSPVKVQNYMKDEKISAHAVIQIIQAVKGDAEKTINEVETAIKAAKDAGKKKATPKHVNTKEVKSQSHGKFYKWCETIADAMPGREDRHNERCEVLEKMLIAYENGQSAAQFAEGFFIDRNKKSAAKPGRK